MIPVIDLKREYAEIRSDVTKAIQRVLDRQWFILGEEVQRFEQEFSDYIGTKHGIGVNSGSDALLLALKALGIGPGDEVITVSNTYISTVDAIVRNGAIPVFTDIDPASYTIDVAQMRNKISQRTKAILPVHLYGHPANMDEILSISKKHGLFVVEDACQAHGAECNGKRVGSLGDIGCFSFYPAKNLGAYGDAGMTVTKNEQLAEKLRMLRNNGQRSKYDHELVGMNSRMDDIQAAILRTKLKYLDCWNNARRKLAARYSELLSNLDLAMPEEKSYARHVFHLYVIRCKQRDRLRQRLSDAGVQTAIHYPLPVHKQQAYLDLGYRVSLPVTEMACQQVLSLPMHPWLTEDEVQTVAQLTRNAFE